MFLQNFLFKTVFLSLAKTISFQCEKSKRHAPNPTHSVEKQETVFCQRVSKARSGCSCKRDYLGLWLQYVPALCICQSRAGMFHSLLRWANSRSEQIREGQKKKKGLQRGGLHPNSQPELLLVWQYWGFTACLTP